MINLELMYHSLASDPDGGLVLYDFCIDNGLGISFFQEVQWTSSRYGALTKSNSASSAGERTDSMSFSQGALCLEPCSKSTTELKSSLDRNRTESTSLCGLNSYVGPSSVSRSRSLIVSTRSNYLSNYTRIR